MMKQEIASDHQPTIPIDGTGGGRGDPEDQGEKKMSTDRIKGRGVACTTGCDDTLETIFEGPQ